MENCTIKPWAEQEALFPVAQGNSAMFDGMKRLVKNQTVDTMTSMQLIAHTIRCCLLALFFFDINTWEMIMQLPNADSDDVNFGSIANRYPLIFIMTEICCGWIHSPVWKIIGRLLCLAVVYSMVWWLVLSLIIPIPAIFARTGLPEFFLHVQPSVDWLLTILRASGY